MSNITLLPIHTQHPFYPALENLMHDAFPPEERRSDERQRLWVDTHPEFVCAAVCRDEEFAGLLTYHRLQDFVYVEHLATLPALRGGGMGAAVIQELIRTEARPIVLEVEPPVSELPRRRIGFYTRCGFKLWDKNTYLQPPYEKHLPIIPLLLMVHGNLDEEKDFVRIREALHTGPYEREQALTTQE